MFLLSEYELLDFGGGRKLERFGDRVVDRPAPATEGIPRAGPEAWSADLRFTRSAKGAGNWELLRHPSEPWRVRHGDLVFDLKPSDSGQVGVFPEHARNWDWLAERISASGRPVELLNLFGYTGGATLAAARAGAKVTHVDASRPAIAWARTNAEFSGLDPGARWIHEDALAFARRESQRGRRYQGWILDPPSYGHGPRGQTWKLSEHLPKLLASLASLLDPEPILALLTCHTPGFGPKELAMSLRTSIGVKAEAGTLELVDRRGRILPQGAFARWP